MSISPNPAFLISFYPSSDQLYLFYLFANQICSLSLSITFSLYPNQSFGFLILSFSIPFSIKSNFYLFKFRIFSYVYPTFYFCFFLSIKSVFYHEVICSYVNLMHVTVKNDILVRTGYINQV